jgi:methionine-rich copper-binding protein CopC
MRGAGALIALALLGLSTVTVKPADGSMLAEPPSEVSVSLPAGGVREAHLSVASAQGVPVTGGPAVMRDGFLVVPVRIVDNGTYLVAFHVVQPDGRVVAGVTRFGVGAAPAGGTMGHAHSDDPINLALTIVAAVSVLALLYVLLTPSSVHRRIRR